MSIEAALAKLTRDDKMEILREIVIRPMVEEDQSLSQEELGDALLAGSKMGFSESEIRQEIDAVVQQEGAIIEEE